MPTTNKKIQLHPLTASGQIDTNTNLYPNILNTNIKKTDGTSFNASEVSVSSTGTATDLINYITINGTEKKIGGTGGSGSFLPLSGGTMTGDITFVTGKGIANVIKEVDAGTYSKVVVGNGQSDLELQGANIKIGNENVATENYVNTQIASIPTYSAGTGISISSNTIAINTSVVEQLSNKKQTISSSTTTDSTDYPSIGAVRSFVNSSISGATATFRGNFATKASLEAYSGTKVNGDYAIVESDETHSGQTWRYKYNGTSWIAEYKLNDTAFTQAQLNAINSGIDSTQVAQFAAKSTVSASASGSSSNEIAYITINNTEYKIKNTIPSIGYTEEN